MRARVAVTVGVTGSAEATWAPHTKRSDEREIERRTYETEDTGVLSVILPQLTNSYL